MVRFAFVLLSLVACVDGDNLTPTCGDAPAFPGFVATFDDGRVILSRENFLAIEGWRADLDVWVACINEGGRP